MKQSCISLTLEINSTQSFTFRSKSEGQLRKLMKLLFMSDIS